MGKKGNDKTSIYLCYLLRHAPEAAGLDMDLHGWVAVKQLIKNVNAQGQYRLTPELLREIVDTDSKGRYRFSPDERRIKACQGHSIPWVVPELEERVPPEYLYHGTTTEALDLIMESGAIERMSRHAVHMQADLDQAWLSAARRRKKTPVVLKIAAGEMHRRGGVFSISENEVWFSDRIPKEYICEILYTGERYGEENGH